MIKLLKRYLEWYNEPTELEKYEARIEYLDWDKVKTNEDLKAVVKSLWSSVRFDPELERAFPLKKFAKDKKDSE